MGTILSPSRKVSVRLGVLPPPMVTLTIPSLWVGETWHSMQEGTPSRDAASSERMVLARWCTGVVIVFVFFFFVGQLKRQRLAIQGEQELRQVLCQD